MKTTLSCLAVFVLIFALMHSCKKQSFKPINTMQAKVNDTLLVCDSIVHLLKGLDGVLYGVEGYTKGPKGFFLFFPIGVGIGTYDFGTFSSNGKNAASYRYGINDRLQSTGGSVTVTHASNDRYSGTFSFPAQGSGGAVKITEGVFDLSK